MDKCHQHLCVSGAKEQHACDPCDENFCCAEHLALHHGDGHKDSGLVDRGRRTVPALLERV